MIIRLVSPANARYRKRNACAFRWVQQMDDRGNSLMRIVRIRSTRSFFDLRCDRARGINTESFRFPASCILHFKVPRFVSCFPRCLSCIRFPVSRYHIPGSSSLVSRFHAPGSSSLVSRFHTPGSSSLVSRFQIPGYHVPSFSVRELRAISGSSFPSMC